MAFHCAVKSCSNGSYKMNKWKALFCDKCQATHDSGDCSCDPPFRLFPFPTKKKYPVERIRWKQLINRKIGGNKIWSPSKDSRVCSYHFKDGEPTNKHPFPTKHLGYAGAQERCNRMMFFGSIQQPTCYKEITCCNEPEPDPEPEPECSQIHVPIFDDPPDDILPPLPFPWLMSILCFILLLLQEIQKLRNKCKKLKEENIKQKTENKKIKNNTHVENILNSDENVTLFTGLTSKIIFDKLHNIIAPLVQRRWLGANTSSQSRHFICKPKRFGPERKISSQAEFLLLLMRLRLGLLISDLAKRFNISKGLCSRIFHAWLKASAKVLGSLVYIPEEESLIGSKPNKFKHLQDLHSIIDYTEIFIETPKDLFLQSATWSDYKHHNTMKILVACTPNSSIIFISEAYMGWISDKSLTLDCEFLDLVPSYSMIMADKSFNISKECEQRNLTLYVPPGKRGKSQMTKAEIAKTKKIANNRIIVEQVIRRLKTFKIIQNELPISLIPHLNDILSVCGGICNLREPIYK